MQDPSIKELAEQIAKDPVFNQMADQLQKSVQNVGPEGVPSMDTQQYISTMQQVMQNPQFMTMAERLGNALMQVSFEYDVDNLCSMYIMRIALFSHCKCFTVIWQDSNMTSMLESFTNPAQKEQLEERMARIKEDPSLKPILDEIESGGPAAMMK